MPVKFVPCPTTGNGVHPWILSQANRCRNGGLELIKLAKEMDAATKRGEDLGLTDDEVAFYDALAANESAVQAMGDDKLKVIATELITQVRKSVTIDWTLREGARAKIRVMVKRILNKYGYPPDLQEEAVKTVLRQAELLCVDWAVV
jgi:type I restriction enzyme, R subunit